ncbi:MAG: helix-turn-helix domain-containing protein [Candidatus Woesearchaeota archaeon]
MEGIKNIEFESIDNLNKSVIYNDSDLIKEDGKYNTKIFVKTLKSLRNEYGMTQVELADKLGKTRGAVGHWETGQREPNLTTLIKLSKIFDVSVDYLLGKTNMRKPNNACEYLIKKIKEANYVKNGDVKREDIENFVKDLELIRQLRGVQ